MIYNSNIKSGGTFSIQVLRKLLNLFSAMKANLSKMRDDSFISICMKKQIYTNIHKILLKKNVIMSKKRVRTRNEIFKR